MKKENLMFNVEADWGKIARRMNKRKMPVRRFKIGDDGIDKVMGGLAYGLNLFCGTSKMGKSMCAKYISKKALEHHKKVLYVCAEDLGDILDSICTDAKLTTLDYTSYCPNARRAVDEVLYACNKVKPDLLVIDSITRLMAGTNKALEESDIRENAFYLAQNVSNKLPTIGISEMRGYGYMLRPAGGIAIHHSAILIATFGSIYGKRALEYNYNKKVYTLTLLDRQNVADTSGFFRLRYKKGDMILKSLKYQGDG